jgi:hypothetical protein
MAEWMIRDRKNQGRGGRVGLWATMPLRPKYDDVLIESRL